MTTERKIAVIGLGYVGLPVALALAKKFPNTTGFDINSRKVDALAQGEDDNRELTAEQLKASSLRFTSNPEDLRGSNFFIIAVPTPVDTNHHPDLGPVIGASRLVGSVMPIGSIVVYESTVYPGVTEEVCGPILAEASGLRQGKDFKLGYSPERINPGDKEHTLERIIKVVAGEDTETSEEIAQVYGAIISAGIHKASSIKVAEAAKVIENTQRDLNIALMNELAMIFDRMQISTKEVLDAAGTKWNFLRFAPGLVGGHCIGVDPYYLTTKAEQLGYHPQVILAGRRINDNMGCYVAQRMVKLMVNAGIQIKGAVVGILGLTFKENVCDLRNSRVPDIIFELKEFGVETLVHDPLADPEHARSEYGVSISPLESLSNLDGLIYAVGHDFYRSLSVESMVNRVRRRGVLVDVKSLIDRHALREDITYWSL